MRYASLPGYFHSMKPFSEFEILPFSHIPAPLFQPTFRVGSRETLYLAFMAAKGRDLEIKGIGDIGTIVYVFSRPEPYRRDAIDSDDKDPRSQQSSADKSLSCELALCGTLAYPPNPDPDIPEILLL